MRLPELVSFTAAINLRSRRLMGRMGFVRKESENFLHPSLDAASPLRLHVLYRKSNPGSAIKPVPTVPATVIVPP